MDPFSFGQIDGLFDSAVNLAPILDELPIGIIVTDVNERILYLNRTFEVLSGFNREEVRGVPCRHVLRSNICHQNCPGVLAKENNGPVTAEGNIINRERHKISVKLKVAPLKNTGGNLVGFIETLEDIRAYHRLSDHIEQSESFQQIIGQSAKMKELFRLIPVVAQTDSSLLITGETGTGKDILAEAIHNSSDRSKDSFVKINCGALPENLLESELFGHKKGAFTGAVNDKPGRLRLAHNGTLYLTEIGDLPLPLQVKLLTFLDDKVVYPLGSTKGFQADVRVIAATHRNLEKMVNEDLFRQDLLYRLNVVRLQLPPLRERNGDIELLLRHYLTIFTTRFGKKIKGFTNQTRHILLNYDYPGNVRELRNIVEYASNICHSESISTEHLPAYLTESGLTSYRDDGGETPPGLPTSGIVQEQSGGMNWSAIERRLIIDTLLKVNGHRSKAAEILGWGRTTLWRKMKQYGLES